MTAISSQLVISHAKRLTFENKEIVLVTLAETDKLDNARVIGSAHDLNFFEDIGTLSSFVSSCQLDEADSSQPLRSCAI